MSEREEAAAAAAAKGREKALFEVVSPLSRNGEELVIGQRIKMARADAEILIGFGKIKPAKGKAKSAELEAGDDAPPPDVEDSEE